jgi:Ni/Co efflux regulator RcnB
MKKNTLFTAVAVLALVGPLAAAPSYAQTRQRRDHAGQHETPSQQAQAHDRGNEDARGDARDHRERREAWRDDRQDARWDDSRYNGYYENNRWTYGQPSADRYQRPGFALGYRPWAVGQSLGHFNRRFQEVDYRRENLRRPTRGSRWVRDDRGDYLLVTRAGRITQVVISGNLPRDRNQNWREANANARWDDARHNGYYQNNRWTFGRPPAGQRGVTLGYQPWRRGEHLGYYQGRYAEVDYRSNRSLRAPPRGQHWVRSDGGDYLLAAIAGGLIDQVILNGTR